MCTMVADASTADDEGRDGASDAPEARTTADECRAIRTALRAIADTAEDALDGVRHKTRGFDATDLQGLQHAYSEIRRATKCIRHAHRRLVRDLHHETQQATQARQALVADFGVLKLTAQSTGPAARVWAMHRARLEAERVASCAVGEVLAGLVARVVAADSAAGATAAAGTAHTYTTTSTSSTPAIRAFLRAITRKCGRRTFYVCSGALGSPDGACHHIHARHAGIQGARPSYKRRDIERHVARVHRVAQASDGYEGSGLLEIT